MTRGCGAAGRALSTALIAVLTVAAAGAIVLSGAPGASAAPNERAARASLTVTDSGTGVLRAGDPLRLGLQVEARSPADLEGARVLLVARSARLTDSAALQRWADGKGVSRGDLVLADASLADLRGQDQEGEQVREAEGAQESGPGGGGAPPAVTTSTGASVEVVADPGVLAGLGGSWGPRGLTVEVVDASGDRLAAARTFVTWLPRGWSPSSRTDLAVLVPFSAGPPDVAGASVPPERLDALVAPDGRLRRTLAVAAAPGTSWQVDPAALGEPALAASPPPPPLPPPPPGEQGEQSSGPPPSETATRWREDLSSAARGRDVSVLPYGAPDPVGLVASGAEQLLEPADARGDALTALLPGATSRLARTASPVLTTGAVETLDAADRRVVVLAPPTPSTRPTTDDEGTDDDRPARVDVRTRAADGEARAAVRALRTAGLATRALVAGTGPADAQRPAPAVTSARLVAESAATARAAPAGTDAALLLAPPAGWDVDPGAALPVIATVLGSPWVSPTTVTELAAQPATATLRAAATAPEAPGQLPREGVASVVESLERARAGAAALSAPGPYLDTARASAVSAVSSAWAGDLETWRSQVEALSRSSSELGSKVRVVEGSAVTVLSAQVDLPVTVVNDFDRAVDVTVSLDSSSPRVQPGGARSITGLGPGDRQRVLVPVRAVASGDVDVQVVLRADDGSQIGSPVALRVKVRADWESRGTAVAAGLVILVLLVGVVRTVRRNRRRRCDPTGGATGDGTGPGTPPGDPEGAPTEDLSVSTGRGSP